MPTDGKSDTPYGFLGAEAEEIILDFFAFQAAACTAAPDCTCGRPADHPVHTGGTAREAR